MYFNIFGIIYSENDGKYHIKDDKEPNYNKTPKEDCSNSWGQAIHYSGGKELERRIREGEGSLLS